MKENIQEKLSAAFSPAYISVEDESHGHNVPDGAESHFKVVMATGRFDGKRPVQRHQLVYGELADELAGSVHALALHLYTPEEWAEQSAAPESPACMGGSKHDR